MNKPATIQDIAQGLVVDADTQLPPEVSVDEQPPVDVAEVPDDDATPNNDVTDDDVTDENADTPDADTDDSSASQDDADDDAVDDEEDADDAEQPKDGEPDQILDILDDDMIEVKIDGETVFRSVADAKKALASDGAHDQRVREATELRNMAREEYAIQTQQMDDAKEAFVQTVAAFEQNMLVPMISEPPVDLKHKDPARYIKHHEAFVNDQNRLNEMRQSIANFVKTHADTVTEAKKTKVQESAARLAQMRPHFADQKTAPKLFEKLITTAVQSYNFQPQEVGAFDDHRLYMLLEDAVKYRELTSKGKLEKSDVVTKRKRAPRKLRSGAVRTASTTAAKQKQQAGLRDKAVQSGKVSDVAALLAVPQSNRR